MRQTIQTILLTIAFTFLAINFAMNLKQKDTDFCITSLEHKLDMLKESRKISSDDFYSAMDILHPLRYPTLNGPWLLRYSGFIISGLLIAHSLLFLWNPRTKIDKETADLDGVGNRDNVPSQPRSGQSSARLPTP